MPDKMLMCMRVSDLKKPVAGSVKSNCPECESVVWISPAGLDMITKNQVEIICNRCGDELTKTAEVSVKSTPECLAQTLVQIMKDAETEGCEPAKLYRFAAILARIPIEDFDEK